jgi:hypothetical protein
MIKPPSRGPSATPPEGPESAPSEPESAASQPESSHLRAAIGRELKALFDGVAAEPVPDRIRRLLDELERNSRRGQA